MIELILNGVSIDLSDNQDFALSFAASKLQDIESRSGDFSTSFSIPLTSSVNTSIGHINRVDSASNLPYQELTAQVLVNGVMVFNGFANIQRVTDVLELNVYSGNSNWITAISEKMLSEIDLSDLNFTMNAANIQARRLNTYGLVYPNAYPGSFADPLIDWTFYDFFPAIYNLRILTQIFDDIGWTIDGDLLTDELFLKSVLPFSNTKIGIDSDFNLFDGFLNLPSAISGTADLIYLGFDSSTINFLTAQVPSTSTTSIGSAPPIIIRDDGFYEFQGVITWNLVSGSITGAVSLIPLIGGELVTLSPYVTNTGVSFGDTSIYIKKGTYALGLFVDTFAGAINMISGGGTYIIANANQNFSIYNNVPEGEILEAYKALPELTQTDFVKVIVNQFNVIIESNYVTKVASFNKFESIKLNKSNALDWTEKVDLSEAVEIQFESDGYGQTNYFKYEIDDNDEFIINKESADGTFLIPDTNLDLEKDLVQLPFSQSVRGAVGVVELLILPIRLYALKPRIAYVEITTDNIITMSGQSTPTNSAELFFDEMTFTNLLINYYPYLVSMLTKFKLIKLAFKINSIDLVNLDYRKPILLDFGTDINGHIRGYFYLNFIEQYNGSNTTTCELIKLN